MRKLAINLALVLISTLISSCSEGDLFDGDINFEANLEKCSNNTDFVFYKIDDNKSLSVNFTSTTFNINAADENQIVSIALNSTTNLLSYRVFDNPIDGSAYFCSSIPPNGINVIDELTSISGTVEITYSQIAIGDTETTYSRTITLRDITLTGPGRAIRKEILILGSDEVVVSN